MTAAKFDLSLEQGATKRFTIRWGTGSPLLPYDLAGCTAEMMIRATLTTSPAALVVDSTVGGGITMQPGGELGRIDVKLSDEETDALTFAKGVYDLEVTWPDGDVARVVQGLVTVSPSVTHPDVLRAFTTTSYPESVAVR